MNERVLSADKGEAITAPRNGVVWFVIVLALMVCAALLVVLIYDWNATAAESDWESRGLRGDFWGGHLAAVGAFGGTLLLLAAVLLQKNELQCQRQELRLQRCELVASREVAKEQAEALNEQRDELRKQNHLAFSRDAKQHILTLAQVARGAIVPFTGVPRSADPGEITTQSTIRRAALTYICGIATVSPPLANELIVLFAATCPRMREATPLVDLLEELSTHAHEIPKDDTDLGDWFEGSLSLLRSFVPQ